MPRSEFEQALEQRSGESIESLRNTPIDERRERHPNKGKASEITLDGLHGATEQELHDYADLVSHEQVERLLDYALRPSKPLECYVITLLRQ